MRQFQRNQMRRRGEPFGRGANKVVVSYVKGNRKYELHCTKGWRSHVLPKEEGFSYDTIH